MPDHANGQVSVTAADYYEEFFVPALFGGRTAQLLDLAGIAAGDTVLDVGCGTGILARDAWSRMNCQGTVAGIDLNEGMLAKARRVSPDIDWQLGQAEALPFGDESYDHVMSQFALMFFENRVGALAEMWRVTKTGGRITVAVWDALANTPGYSAMAALYSRLFGEAVANELVAPYSLGDRELLAGLFAEAGIAGARLTSGDGMARFDSIRAWVGMDVDGWTLGEVIGPEGHQLLLESAELEMQGFMQGDGSVAFSAPSHLVTAVKP